MRDEILIVEDSATQAEQLRHLLEEQGFATRVAANGREALEAARAARPSLIVSDVMMPEMDGYELCKRVKQDADLAQVPVLLLTSLAGPQNVLQALECGADSLIRKPYGERDLESRIDFILANQQIRASERTTLGVEVVVAGRKHLITAARQQMLDLLISTYEDAVRLNEELQVKQNEILRSAESLHGLYRIAEGLNRSTEEAKVLNETLDHALDLPGIEAGWIFLCEDGAPFRLVTRGLSANTEAVLASYGECVCQRRLLSGELDRVTNITECERLAAAHGEGSGPRYHASVPLRVGGRSIGIMNLAGSEERAFNREELDLVSGIGNQVALAIERARLYEHLEAEVEKRTADLRESRQRLQLAIASGDIGLWDWDTAKNEIYFSPEWKAQLGYEDEEIANRFEEWETRLHPDDRRRTMQALSDHLADPNSTYETEFRLRHKAGGYRWIFTRATAIRDEQGRVTRMLGAHVDITGRKRAEEQILRLNLDLERRVRERTAEIEAANRELEAFSYSVSHDLRAPLRAIDGFSRVLEEDYGATLDPQAMSHLGRVRAATARMGSLIDDLLELARVSRGEMQQEPVDLSALTRGIAAELRRNAPERDVRFVIAPGVVVRGDRRLLEVALNNLLDNAWKYTSKEADGRIEFGTRRESGQTVYLVSDTGVGFDMKDAGKLFAPFRRLHSSADFEGTGVGLATVDRIVRRHGGRVWADSAPGRGATFYFTLGAGAGEE